MLVLNTLSFNSEMMILLKKTTALRKLMEEEMTILAPGAYDAMTAKLVEVAGFKMIGTTGAGIAGSLLAAPDVGMLTRSQSVMIHRNMAAATTIPIIADADTGYGNAVGVMRTVQEFECAGVAGIIIEDQTEPKRCGLLAGKEVTSVEEMVGKIKAAREARDDPDFVIVARTDSASVHGVDEAIKRANEYVTAGADLVKTGEGVGRPRKEVERFVRSVKAPIHMGAGPNVGEISISDLEMMGHKMIISMPVFCYGVAFAAVKEALLEVKTKKCYTEKIGQLTEIYNTFGYEEYTQLEETYLPKTTVAQKYKR
jgi:methylisocitrate lyase